MISAGAPAPDFTLPRTGGGTLTLSALRPAKVVLYFYPKDDTPGCTTEALDFTRLAARFRAAGTEVIGISKDSLARHQVGPEVLTLVRCADTFRETLPMASSANAVMAAPSGRPCSACSSSQRMDPPV